MSAKLFRDPDHTLYLLDISSFIFRAFFAIRALKNSKGEPTNAVYGVASMLMRLIEEADPKFLAVAYDSKEPSFREEIYEDYKANRSAPPDDLIPQFARVDELVKVIGIHAFRKDGVEADDLIASMAREWCARSPENQVVIVTGDKDLMQLVNARVQIWDTMKGVVYGASDVKEKMGVGPEQVRDYLALVGDSSDNIPGVPSIGPKTAVGLIEEYGTLDAALKAAAQGKISGKKGEVLKEHRKEAELSYELVGLKHDVKVPMAHEDLAFRFTVTEACAHFLKEMDFKTLLEKWQAKEKSREDSSSVGVGPVSVAQDPRFRTLDTEAKLDEAIAAIRKVGWMGVDVETTSLNPREAELVGIALCYDEDFAWYLPLSHRVAPQGQLELKKVIQKLGPVLADPKIGKIGQNLKYDWSVFQAQGIPVHGILADTMVAGYVLDPTDRQNLEKLSARYLEYQTMPFEAVCGKGKNQITFDLVPVDQATRYSAEDAWCAVRLWKKMEPLLKAEGLTEVFEKIDLPLVEVIGRMEMQGVCIDSHWFKKLSHEFEKELAEIEKRVQAFTSGPINLNSPKQLSKLLFEDLKLPVQSKTKTGLSTDATVLEALAPLHEVPRLLLEYREIAKLKGTYVDPLPQLKDAKTGKIHASFHQAVTATGRLSSSDPNLQNIPIRSERGLKIRRGFVPSPGNVLISADYSQIELRILAHMSGDADLKGSFLKGEDVHRRTASEIFNIAPDQVDDRQRSIAKAINFGLMYGKTPHGLSQELKIPRAEAKDMIDRYFTRYATVKKFLDHLISSARETGFVKTLSGRKRALPEIRSQNFALRGSAERMAMNTPIQGTAADLMKLAMTKLDQELAKKGFEARLVIQVHDEVLIDCPEKESQEVQKLVIQVLESAMKLDVPLVVNVNVGANWAEL